jgi:hypothetical protein
VNQHYNTNKAILPDLTTIQPTNYTNNGGKSDSPKISRNRSPYNDPYSFIPVKPNQLSEVESKSLKSKLVNYPAAGIAKDSPFNRKSVD